MATNAFECVLSLFIHQSPIRRSVASSVPEFYFLLMASLASADSDKRGLAGRGGGGLPVGKFIVVTTIDLTAEVI